MAAHVEKRDEYDGAHDLEPAEPARLRDGLVVCQNWMPIRLGRCIDAFLLLIILILVSSILTIIHLHLKSLRIVLVMFHIILFDFNPKSFIDLL